MSADILIVDDEADIRDLVAGILDDEGHRTRTAGGSDEALAAIESRRPHLVFLDISGCRARASTGFRCSTRSRPGTPTCRW
jgi:DNA-binding NtrC family response regulator